MADLRRELFQDKPVSLPLLHPMGEAQVDFGATVFIEKGVEYKGYHLAVTLPFSDAKYVQLFKGQNSECLAQGLIDIFYHIGGVPTAIWFDNMSTAVKAIKALGVREVTESFRRLQCHFGFKSNFCNPNSGHEKGSVENYVGYSRRNHFVPVPQVDHLARYNQQLLLDCDDDLNREHYKKEVMVYQLFNQERSALLPLPVNPFDACGYVIARTNAYGMALFQTNRYSTSGQDRNRNVTLKVGAHEVHVLDERMNLVVQHPPIYGKNRESMIWAPYLDVLAKRPTALRYSTFFNQLPTELKAFLSECSLEEKKRIIHALARHRVTVDFEQLIQVLTEAWIGYTK